MMMALNLLESLTLALAMAVPEVQGAAVDGVVRAPFTKVTHKGIGSLHFPSLNLEKRDDSVKTDLDAISNQRYYYLTEVDIGTPAQKLDLLLDTGSSDTWVFSGQTRVRGGARTTVFNETLSSSYKPNGTTWQIKYGKGQASGSWGTDKFKIGGATLKQLSIGVADKVSQISTGLVGIGRPQAEITVSNGGSQYNNLPLEMQAEGIINSAAYSLALEDLQSSQGSILFGGVDHDQYSGKLLELPIVHPKHMGVMLQGMNIDGRANYPLLGKPNVAVLDSGTSLTYVDGDTLGALRTALNSNPSFAIGTKYYTDCNITSNLNLDFGGVKIAVPSWNFMWPIEMFVDGITAALDFPQNSCYIGIEQSSRDESFLLLGDNVLRAMYLVYDITDNRIAVAQAKSGSGKPQIEAIMPGKPIPGSVSS